MSASPVHARHAHPPARPWERLRHLLRPEGRDILSIGIYALAVALLSLATPIAVETLVNTVAFGVLLWPIVVLSAILLGCLGMAAAIRAMQVYVVECIQRRLFIRVVGDYAHRLPRIRLDALDGQNGPELVNRFFDVLSVQKSLSSLLLDGISIVVTTVVGMVVLAFYHPFLLGFDVVLIILIAFLLFVLGIGGVSSSLHESHVKYDTAAWLEELVRTPKAFKFAGGRHLALEHADELAGHYAEARKAHFRIVWRQTVFALGLQVVASTVLLGLGGWLVIQRQLTLGQLVASELIVALVVASVAKLGKYAEAYYDLMAGAEKLGLLTDLPLERSGGESLPDREGGMAVRLRGLSGVVGRPFPRAVDAVFRPGDRVAIVGPAGSGKSTLLEMICALRDPASGVVELDGIDVRGLNLDSVRERVALLSGPDIFAGTVAENLRVGRPHLSATELREALDAVGLLAAVHDLPEGLDTFLTPPGDPLTHTQSARLGIARALVGRPRLLVLDGILDAIDLADCPNLISCLFDRSAPWTLLISSTDPKVIGLCDRTLDLATGANS